MRPARVACASLCVTITTVVPDAAMSVSIPITSLPLRRVEIAGRLVGQDKLWLGHKGSRHGDTLLLTALTAVAADGAPGGTALRVRESQQCAACRSEVRTPAIDQRHLDVLGHCQLVNQVEALEHEADVGSAQQRQPAFRGVGEIFAQEEKVAPGLACRAARGCSGVSTCRIRTAP